MAILSKGCQEKFENKDSLSGLSLRCKIKCYLRMNFDISNIYRNILMIAFHLCIYIKEFKYIQNIMSLT